MEDDEHDVSFKLILIGDAGVGKTNILSRFILDDFSIETPSTISMEFGRKILEIGGKKVKLQIWDTAGQEKYRAVTKSYIKGSRGAFLIYDISRKETFENIDMWYKDIKETGDKDCVIELVGNKMDLEESRQVSSEEGKNKALELNTLFMETSALRGDYIEEAFDEMVKEIMPETKSHDTPQKEEEKKENIGTSVVIKMEDKPAEQKDKTKKGKCCK